MNYITKEIAARFGITTSEALDIQAIVESDLSFDLSEASQKELEARYDEAFREHHAGI